MVNVTDTHIETAHDKVPRFGVNGGLVIEQSTEITSPKVIEFIEVKGELTINSQLRTNTILGHPGSTIRLLPGAEILFEGSIPDADGAQFELGLVTFGKLIAEGTPLNTATWVREGEAVDWVKSRDITIRGLDRGHVMITGDGSCDVQFVHFDNMGRTTVEKLAPITNQIGRYSLHLHRVTSTGSRVVGCLFTRPLKWAGTIHDTHDSVWTDNVFIGDGVTSGALLAIEMGNETGHVIRKNLFVNSTGKTEKRDVLTDNGFEGHGLWLHSQTRQTIEDNVSVDCSAGFTIFSPRLPVSITRPDGEIISQKNFVPTSWRNTSIRCKTGLVEWPSGNLSEHWKEQNCFGCHWGVSHIGGTLWVRNSHIDRASVAILSSRYAGIRANNLRVTNCVNGVVSQTRHIEGSIETEGNTLDYSLFPWGLDHIFDVTTSTLPTISHSRAPFRAEDRIKSLSAGARGRTVIRLPDKVVEVMMLQQLPNSPYPDDFPAGEHYVFDAETVGEVWEKFGIAPRMSTIRLGANVTTFPGIVDKSSGVPLQCVIHDELPVWEPRELVHIGKVFLDSDRVVINSIMPAWVPGDRVHVLFDGQQVWSSGNYFNQLRVPSGEVSVVTLQHVRGGVVLSSDDASFTGKPIDPREIELTRLRFQAQQLEAELSILEKQLISKQDLLETIKIRITELEDELE